jgi:SAM-dependent methyltransferase
VPFSNVYDDAARAEAYARLELPGTYYLAYRDLPAIIAAHMTGGAALDFGCGAGRSTRFIEELGFDAVGIDISRSMIAAAKKADPDGDYRLVGNGDFSALAPGSFDLVLSAFAFDNIPDVANRRALLQGLRHLLRPDGRIIMLGSTPEIYRHEWASFTTKAFPENRVAKSGEVVRIVMTDVGDPRPVLVLVWFRQDYLSLFAASGLELCAEYRPLGRADEPYAWVSETTVARWFIYVLERSRSSASG